MKRAARTGAAPQRSPCPIANALDLLGDKWTLLVVRDLMYGGKQRYNDFLASPEGIPSNLLAQRLKRLEAAGLVEKRPYQTHPVRYEYRLSRQGAQLRPVMTSIIKWAMANLPDVALPPTFPKPPSRRR